MPNYRNAEIVLTLSCPDRMGIVARVATFLVERDSFIIDSQQFSDPDAKRFFMRVAFRAGGPRFDPVRLEQEFTGLAEEFRMDWRLSHMNKRTRVLIAVSKYGHCLNDLLHRWRIGALAIDIPVVFSNHDDMRSLTEWHGIPFVWVGQEAGKAAQEARLRALMEEHKIDLVVLARYMQILSPELCADLAGRCINIHHSFLPSFKGAGPYKQAHARGVKLIGATAHFVTTDLDEGPIIEQAVERVDHGHSVARLTAIGRDIESAVLARAVSWTAEHRILLSGDRTIVFR
ncbi:MAG: formyltetrahydrofolate deformylase [Hyphomonadaceae bacterium]